MNSKRKRIKKTVVISLAAVVVIVAAGLFLMSLLSTSVYMLVPEFIHSDPVRQQVSRKTKENTEGPFSHGNVWLEKPLKTIESVEVEGAVLQMYILGPESSYSVGGSPENHILHVYISRTDEYIDGFTVIVNGERYELSRAPESKMAKLLGPDTSDDDTLVGLRSWSNKWFPVGLRPPPLRAPKLSAPPGTVLLKEGEEYASHTAALPYEVGSREIVSWPAGEPGMVIVTSMDETVEIEASN